MGVDDIAIGCHGGSVHDVFVSVVRLKKHYGRTGQFNFLYMQLTGTKLAELKLNWQSINVVYTHMC